MADENQAQDQPPAEVGSENENANETLEQTNQDDATGAVTPSLDEKWKENAAVAQESNKERFGRIKGWLRTYWEKKKVTLPITAVVLLLLLLGLPLTRYPILGTFIKKDYQLSVVDATTKQPVTGATITVAGKSTQTDNHGLASVHTGVGKHGVVVSKKYYKVYNGDVFVGFSDHGPAKLHVVATGRQVPITIVNKITGKPLENAEIKASGSSAKTDKQGKAILVLPTTGLNEQASITLGGYNSASVKVQITDQKVSGNTFSLTPAGKLYFLSNKSGKIDVVKTDLDGANRKTILAGTGSEDTFSTALLASRDWKYLALLSKRSANTPAIYLIDTSSDKVTNIDEGNTSISFTLVGWSGDTFVYQVGRANVQSWQSGGQALKSYDASAGKLYSIDQTQGEGTSSYDYAFTNFGTISILDNELVYVKNWYGSSVDHLAGKNDSLVSVKPDGSSKKSIKDFLVPAGTQYGYFVSTSQYEPQSVYVQVPNGNNTNTYYEYEDGKLSQKDITEDTFNKGYPTYLVSPTGKQTFWSDARDGKNTLFVGSANAGGAKQIASLSEYTPYGWFSDDYLLVTKSGSELYIMPTDGSKLPFKVTDYYKPQLTFKGYGGGYGGL